MSYRWNTFEFIKRKQELLCLTRKKCLPKSTKETIAEDISNYTSLFYGSNPVLEKMVSLSSRLKKDTLLREDPLTLKDISKNTLMKIIDLGKDSEIAEYLYGPEDVSLEKIEKGDIFRFLDEIYHSLGKRYEEIYRYYKDPKNHLLYICPFKNSEYGGYMQRIYLTNRCYAKVYSRCNIQDIISCGHEIFHTITSKSITYQYERRENFYLDETDGYFFNYVAFDYLRKTEYKEDANAASRFDNEMILDSIDTLTLRFFLQKFYRESSSLEEALSKIGQYYATHFGHITQVSPHEISSIREDSIHLLVKQIVSSLVGYELFERYQIDPEKTLWEVTQISHSTDSIDKTLEQFSLSCLNKADVLKKVLK